MQFQGNLRKIFDEIKKGNVDGTVMRPQDLEPDLPVKLAKLRAWNAARMKEKQQQKDEKEGLATGRQPGGIP